MNSIKKNRENYPLRSMIISQKEVLIDTTVQEKNITFKVSPEQLVQYNEGQWIIEPGSYEFMIAASSTDTRLRETIEIKGDARILENGRSIFFSLND